MFGLDDALAIIGTAVSSMDTLSNMGGNSQSPQQQPRQRRPAFLSLNDAFTSAPTVQPPMVDVGALAQQFAPPPSSAPPNPQPTAPSRESYGATVLKDSGRDLASGLMRSLFSPPEPIQNFMPQRQQQVNYMAAARPQPMRSPVMSAYGV